MPYNVRYLAGGHPAAEFGTLEQAMAHTGHTDLDDWCLSREGAGQIRTDWTLRYDPATDGGGLPLDYGGRDRDHPYLNRVWAIEAPGVAHELIALLAAGDLTRRHWGTEDGVIKAAARDRLPDADATASIVVAQLAAHYAAAGELTPGLIEAIIANTYSASDGVLDQAAIAEISRRVADALRNAGIAVAPRLTARVLPSLEILLATASTGPGKPGYQVWRADEAYHGTGWGEPYGQHGSLTAAMAAAGHGDYADWGTRPGMPDTLFLIAAATLDTGESCADHVPPWTIEGHNVAREFAETCPGIVRTATTWSRFDERIIAAVISGTRESRAELELPVAAAISAGARLAARYGTSRDEGGSITTVDVRAVLADAYTVAGGRALPPGVAESIARDVVRRFTDSGVAVVGQAAAMSAPWQATEPGQVAAIRGGTDLELQTWPHAAWFGSPWAAAVAEKIVDALGAVTAAGEICALGMLGAISAFGSALMRGLDRLGHTIHVVTIPAGPLPRWLCALLSYMISHVLIPFGLPFLGVWLTCWPDSWHALAARWVPVAGWVAAGSAAEKLVGFRVPPAGVQPEATQDGERKVAVVVSFVLVAAAAAWPWPGWWAAHLHLRVVLAVLYAAGAVFASAVMISQARQRSRPGNARPRPGRRQSPRQSG